MNVHVDIQSASCEPVPEEEDIRRWISAALESPHQKNTLPNLNNTAATPVELSVRVVDTAEMSALNQTYRGKSGPTNVLSFPADLPDDIAVPLLGDIVICAPVVREEAQQQAKPLDAHWAHMTVHGTLHLLGYDHIEEHEATHMETLETTILDTLNYASPYEEALAGGNTAHD
ncbi:MAG: rRNA maturation RNase YbeY [Halioglobus sp.]